jgi:hypothetical protein
VAQCGFAAGFKAKSSLVPCSIDIPVSVVEFRLRRIAADE